jgi:predicted dehydrogenase
MKRIRIGLVGCGGMGTRHLHGLRSLTQTPFNNVDLVALCDINRETAELAAKEASRLLGVTPPVFTDLEEMATKVEMDAVDVVTDPSVHHEVVCTALGLGLHVMVEKPMAITVGACRLMMAAAKKNARVLSVAENYRRDPSARLVNHLLNAGAIGKPYHAVLHYLSAGRQIFITPWRHLKNKGGPLVDMGVHFTDLIRYQLGDVQEVCGDVRLVEQTRTKSEVMSMDYEFYKKRFQAMDSEVPADAEDVSMAQLKMASGVTVNWVVGMGGYGSLGAQLILGAKGVCEGFGSRGARVKMRAGEGEELSQEEMLAIAEGFEVNPLSQHFFPTGISHGDSEVDWKLIAMEYHEFAEAILEGKPVEVDGTEGMKDVAAIYAIFESSLAGRSVTMDEVESCGIYGYQADIDRALGIEYDHNSKR